MSVSAPPDPGATACPRCGAHVAEDQEWCLNCGDAARTRLAPTPNWRLPVAFAAVVATLAGLALAVAFVQLTRDETPLQPTDATTATVTTAPPAVAPAPTTAAPTVTTAPTTEPGATTTPPGATTAEPGTTTTEPGAATAEPGATTTAPGRTTTP